MKRRLQRVIGVKRFDDAVHRRVVRIFLDIAAEQAIPDHQHAGIVTVDIAVVARVMHAMNRRRVEHVLEPAELADRLRVHEKLEAEIDQHDRDNLLRRKAEHGERNPEQPHAGNRIHQALAERGRKIHPLR